MIKPILTAIDRATEVGGYLKAMDMLMDENDCLGTVYLILDKLRQSNKELLVALEALQKEQAQ